MVNLLPAVYSLSGLALMDLAGAVNVRGTLGGILGFGNFDGDQFDLELGQIEQEIDGIALSADLGVSVTPYNITRLQARLREHKAKLKYAKTAGQKRRWTRLIGRLEAKLARAEKKLERRVDRRQSKGKELTRRQKTALALLKSKKEKKEDRAKARAKAKGLVGVDAIKGVPYRTYLKYIRGLEPRVYAATRPLFAMGAMTGVAVARYEAAVNQIVAASSAKAATKASAIAHFKKHRTAYVAQWLKGAPSAPGASAALPVAAAAAAAAALPGVVAGGARPVLPVLPPAILQARIARRQALQAQLAQMQAQQQALAQQQAQAASAAQAQALAAQRAQYQQQLMAMQQQMAQFSVPSSPVYIPPAVSSFQPSQVSERGGAFQAFPHSTSLEQGPGPAAPQGDEGAEGSEGAEGAEDAEGAEGAEGAEDGEGADAGAAEAGDDTPFYKKPIFFVLLAGAGAAYYYSKKKGKDGKDKKAAGTPAA